MVISEVEAMGSRERRERVGPEKETTVLGVQEWFVRARRGERQRPRGV